MRARRERGRTLIEMLVVAAVVATLAGSSLPVLKAYTVRAHLVGAALKFKAQFLRARSAAITTGRQTAIRFETDAAGVPFYSVYVDGNGNGVLAADIRSGVDRRIEGPSRLDAGAPGVSVAIRPKTPAIPPDSGTLSTADPIRFGRGEMLSFSPLGTATPGTFYLAGETMQAAVRVTGATARVRILLYEGKAWREK